MLNHCDQEPSFYVTVSLCFRNLLHSATTFDFVTLGYNVLSVVYLKDFVTIELFYEFSGTPFLTLSKGLQSEHILLSEITISIEL